MKVDSGGATVRRRRCDGRLSNRLPASVVFHRHVCRTSRFGVDSYLDRGAREARKSGGGAALSHLRWRRPAPGYCWLPVVVAAASALILPLVASSFPPDKLAYTAALLLLMIAVVPLSGLSSTWRAVLNSEHQFRVRGRRACHHAARFDRGIVRRWANSTECWRWQSRRSPAALWKRSWPASASRRLGYPIIPRWTGVSPALRQVAAQYAPLVAITLVMTGSALVDQSVAARLGSGSVAALSYGTRLLGVLMVIGPTAMGTAVLPHISAAAVLARTRASSPNLAKLRFFCAGA